MDFRSVILDPVQISFAANFDPNQGRRTQSGRLNADDLAAITERLAGLFHETFCAELARGGYTLVDLDGPDTLRVAPAVIKLFTTAPGDATDSGQMTVVMEMRDSVTGEVLFLNARHRAVATEQRGHVDAEARVAYPTAEARHLGADARHLGHDDHGRTRARDMYELALPSGLIRYSKAASPLGLPVVGPREARPSRELLQQA